MLMNRFEALDGSYIIILYKNGTCIALNWDDNVIASGTYDSVLIAVKSELNRIADSCIG